MKKINKLILLLVALLVIISCKKSNNNDTTYDENYITAKQASQAALNFMNGKVNVKKIKAIVLMVSMKLKLSRVSFQLHQKII